MTEFDLLTIRVGAPSAQTGSNLALWVAVIGFVSGVVLAALNKLLEWRREAERRKERIKDIIAAVFYEIQVSEKLLKESVNEIAEEEMRSKIHLFGPSDPSPFVYNSIEDDITILPTEVIESVVRYYQHAARANKLVDYLVQPRYKDLVDKLASKDARNGQTDDKSEAEKRLRQYTNNIIVANRLQLETAREALATLSEWYKDKYDVELQKTVEPRRSDRRGSTFWMLILALALAGRFRP